MGTSANSETGRRPALGSRPGRESGEHSAQRCLSPKGQAPLCAEGFLLRYTLGIHHCSHPEVHTGYTPLLHPEVHTGRHVPGYIPPTHREACTRVYTTLYTGRHIQRSTPLYTHREAYTAEYTLIHTGRLWEALGSLFPMVIPGYGRFSGASSTVIPGY